MTYLIKVYKVEESKKIHNVLDVSFKKSYVQVTTHFPMVFIYF